MTTRDYNQRTSHLYDDRDADTITSLSTPIIKTCDANAPDFAFFLVPTQSLTVHEGGSIPEVNLNVESYVKMSSLPKELAQSVRQALQGK